MIHCENVADVYTGPKMFLWLLSAFKAGFINSAGFLISGKFVSHVTGFGTQVGVAIGHQDYFLGTELLIIPISFIMGGVISSLILESGDHEKHLPKYYLVQGLITLLILVVILFEEFGLLPENGLFDADGNYNIFEFSIIGIFCLVCGLKNSLVTWTTYGKIRVTHLTGLSTDFGLHLPSMISSKFKTRRLKERRIINYHRLVTLLCFSLGACISAMLYPTLGFRALYIPFIISLFMTIISILSNVKAIAK